MTNYVYGIFVGSLFTTAITFFAPQTIKSDYPLTPHKEIKVDTNGDSTITYIYKL